MIVVDSSALIAMMLGGPAGPNLAVRLAGDVERVMSTASYLEAGTVLAGRQRTDRLRAVDDLDAFLTETGISFAAVDANQARIALIARIRYGRGMGHGGTLNFGDAFSYALATTRRAPLLFVGDDFSKTDVVPAMPPGEA